MKVIWKKCRDFSAIKKDFYENDIYKLLNWEKVIKCEDSYFDE